MEATWDTIFRDSTKFWVQFVFVPLVVIIGVLGNSLTIYILTRKQMRLSSKVYLTALTLSDLLFLLFSFSMSWKHYDCMKSVQLYWKYIPFGLWITDASSSTSVWLTVCFTIERYIAICHPMLAKCTTSTTKHRAVIVSGSIYLICFLLTATTSFEWRAISANSELGTGPNNTFILENTDLGKNAWYRLIYRWFTTIVFVLIPLLILVVGNIFLIQAVRASHKIRQGLVSCYVHRRQAQKMRQQDRITINLIVIVVVFFICQLPTAAVLIYTSMHTPLKDSVEENVLLGLGNLFNLLVAINAECNFILYTAISDKYRKTFLRMFCLKSVFKRWYEKKCTKSVAVVVTTLAVDTKLRYTCKATFEKGNSVVRPRIPFSSRVESGREMPKNAIAVMRKCTTCEEIENAYFSSSGYGSNGPSSI